MAGTLKTQRAWHCNTAPPGLPKRRRPSGRQPAEFIAARIASLLASYGSPLLRLPVSAEQLEDQRRRWRRSTAGAINAGMDGGGVPVVPVRSLDGSERRFRIWHYGGEDRSGA